MDQNKALLKGRIPKYLIDQLDSYQHEKIKPHSFLTKILENDLRGSFQEATVNELMALPDIVQYVYTYLTYGSGSKEAVNSYLNNTQ